MALDELATVEDRFVVGTYARQQVEFVSGQGSWLKDCEGNHYLDLFAGVAVCQIGHCHPDLVAALERQLETLIHVSNHYYTATGIELARRLAEGSLGGKVFFANSGAEANECAIKLARRRRPAGEIVVLEGAFHGRTLGALSATPDPPKQRPFEPLVPGFVAVDRENPQALADAVTERTAAVFIEPIQGESGVHPISAQMLETARTACDRTGAVLVFDEIQCGVGRTGSLWAYEQTRVEPDVITTAKGLGGGLPIGACITSPAHADVLRVGDHGSTFAAGPVVCAGAEAVLDVVDDAQFLDAVTHKGQRLASGLERLRADDVRGRGLMVGFEVEDAPGLARRALSEQKLVINATGPTSARLTPALTITDDEIDDGLSRLGTLLG